MNAGLMIVLALQQPAGQDGFIAGRRALDARQWRVAAEHFEAAVRSDSSSSTYRMWLARAYAENARRGGLAEQLRFGPRIKPNLSRAVTLDPDNHDARFLLVEYLLRAPGLAGGSVTDAIAHADTLARRNAYLGSIVRARVAERRGDSSSARDTLRKTIAAYPDSSAPYARLFDLLSDSAGHVEAMRLAERLLDTRCCRRLALYYTGRLSLFAGVGLERGARALKEYLRGGNPRDGEPTFAYAHLRLGEILVRLGRPTEARGELEAALREDSSLDPVVRPLLVKVGGRGGS